MGKTSNYILLLGAGFSRNWGGWLASEAFEYLIGSTGLNQTLRNKLWHDKKLGKDFEATLADLQLASPSGKKSEDLKQLESALITMFGDMNRAFDGLKNGLDFSNYVERGVTKFLSRFDAIFTLNQDLLLERHYNSGNMAIGSSHSGWYLPGIKQSFGSTLGSKSYGSVHVGTTDNDFRDHKNLQPVFKLHGSSDWLLENNENLLVMGGNKKGEIGRHPVLKWYSDKFNEHLEAPNTKLMVIGYSFRDEHINAVIQKFAANRDASIFLIDPEGVDIVDKNRGMKRGPNIYVPDSFAEKIWPRVIGASRRPLNATFSDDDAEFDKVCRFFE